MPSDSNNKATVDGNGNIIIQNVNGSTIEIGRGSDPETLKKLKAFGEDIGDIEALVEQSIEIMLKRLPKQLTVKEIPALIRQGSRKFYEEVRSPKGRFGHIEKIEEALFCRLKLKRDPKDPKQSWTLEQRTIEAYHLQLKILWKEDDPYSIFLGKEGMGKTVSFLALWEYFNRQDNGPIPLYVALNEYNQATPEARKNFITWYIGHYYLGKSNLSPEHQNTLWEWLQSETPPDTPKMQLLLDGFNEITVDKEQLVMSIQNQWINKAKDISILLTTRNEENFAWAKDFHIIEFEPLREKDIQAYLGAQQPALKYPEDRRLRELLSNPMILKLYTGTSAGEAQFVEDELISFRESRSSAELIWNFIESQLAKTRPPDEVDADFITAHFMIKYFVPYLAYEMEKQGLQDVSEPDFESLTNEAYICFFQPEFFSQFRRYRPHVKHYRQFIRELGLGALEFPADIIRFEQFLHSIDEVVFPITKEGASYRFLHQNYRDFFAAVHIINEIRLALECGRLPEVLSERPLSPNLRQMIGELEGEHYRRPVFLEMEEAWSTKFDTPNLLSQVLDLCRNVFDGTIGYTVWNVIEIIKDVRKSLAGINLTLLDLEHKRISLHRVPLSKTQFPNRNLVVKLSGSRIHPQSLISQMHKSAVRALAYSPDGQFILSGAAGETSPGNEINEGEPDEEINNDTVSSPDFSLKLWSLATGQCAQTFTGHTAPILFVTFSQDSAQVISGSEDLTVKVWSVTTGQCIRTFECKTMSGTALSYHHASQCVVSAREMKPGAQQETEEEYKGSDAAGTTDFRRTETSEKKYEHLDLWMMATSEYQYFFSPDFPGERPSPYDRIDSLAFSADGQYVLSGYDNGKLRMWSVKARRCLWSIPYAHASGKVPKAAAVIHRSGATSADDQRKMKITKVVFGPNGQWVASGDAYGRVYVRRMDSGNLWCEFENPGSPVHDLDFSPDGQQLLCAWEDAIALCSVSAKQRVWTVKRDDRGNTPVTFTPNGHLIMAGYSNGMVVTSDLRGGKIHSFQAHTGPVSSLTIAPDGKSVATSSANDNTIRLWDQQGQEIQRFTADVKGFWCLAFSSDGNSIVAGASSKALALLWEVKSGAIVREFKVDNLPQENSVYAVAFSPEGDKILASSEDGNARIWPLNKDEPTVVIKNEHEIMSVAFSPTKPLILIGSKDPMAGLLDVEGKPVRPFPGHSNGASIVAFSPEGEKVLTCSAEPDFSVRLWDYQKQMEPICEFKGHKATILSAAFSPDGQYLVTSDKDGQVTLWDINTASMVRTLYGPAPPISSAAFSPDGKTIVSAAENGELDVWLTETGQQLYRFHEGIRGGTFSDDWLRGCDLSDVWWVVAPTPQEESYFQGMGNTMKY
ncbi:MAG: hypothetical protein KDD15_00050 [Lewinella sp.]|nr:hypothetical protein [Lewinella sp.]